MALYLGSLHCQGSQEPSVGVSGLTEAAIVRYVNSYQLDRYLGDEARILRFTGSAGSGKVKTKIRFIVTHIYPQISITSISLNCD